MAFFISLAYRVCSSRHSNLFTEQVLGIPQKLKIVFLFKFQMFMTYSTVLQVRLEEFINSMPIVRLTRELATNCAMSEAETKAFLDLYINEMRVTLDMVGENLRPDIKILEVGAGLCLFSVFLKQQGHDITALEPSVGGFGKCEVAKKVILDVYSNLNLRVLEFPAQDLLSCNDKFDFLFSNNVLEHIPNLKEAWLGMCSVLSPQGIMMHNCPNYLFPYEPHFGIPVFKFFPSLSARIFKNSIAKHRNEWEQEALWASLNFISYFDVKKLAKISGMKLDFRKELLFKALNRIEHDALFRERHRGSFVFLTYSILKKTGLLGLLRFLPPVLSTPMIFRCSKTSSN